VGYKQTEVGLIPREWNVLPCSALSTFITVGIVVKPAQYYVASGIPALRSANIREDGVSDADMVFISERANSLLSKSQVRSGDVLTVRTGYPGTSAVVPPRLSGANCIDILITRPAGALVSPHFLAAWINSSHGRGQVLRNQGGLAQQHFNVGDLRDLLVALPPTKAEQEAIAEALSDADALIESLEQLLAKKHHLKQGAMQELLTGKKRLPGFSDSWVSVRLGELATFSKGWGLPKSALDPFGGEPCIHYGELFTKYKEVIEQIESRTSISTAPVRSTFNDVLMPTSDVTPNGLAKASCVQAEGVILGGDILVLRVDSSRLYAPFLSYVVRFERDQILQLVTGSTVFHLYAADMKKFAFVLPSTTEQQAIVDILNSMDAEIAALEAKLTKAREVKQGMMQELLTGRIRLV
jgi:type I restriction enzyme S subunit